MDQPIIHSPNGVTLRPAPARENLVSRSIVSCIALLTLALPAARAELIVEQFQWGVSDQVSPGEFNALAVLLYNTGEQPREGVMTLRGRDDGGATYVQPFYVGADQRRWLRFYPYVPPFGGEWTLTWGTGPRRRLPLMEPTSGIESAVLLHDEDRVIVRGAQLRVLPESRFPLTAAVTTGLRDIVLDHVPQMNPQQRQALMDWLHRGGRLHLIQDDVGRWPEFSGELATLNIVGDADRVGLGSVFRHPCTAHDLDRDTLATMGIDALRSAQAGPAVFAGWGAEQFLFPALRSLVQPHHSWIAIYLMAGGFLLLIGPVHALLSRKLLGYRMSILFLVAVAGLCTWLNFYVGRRGFGETTALYSLSYAQALEPGRYDVVRWSNLFVTTGGVYRLQHHGDHHLYAVGETYDPIRGRIHVGAPSFFDVEMPLFTSRAYIHRATVPGPSMNIEIADWQTPDDPQSPVIATIEFKPEHREDDLLSQAVRIWAIHDRSIHEVQDDGDTWQVTFDRNDDVRTVLSDDDQWRFAYYGGWDQREGIPMDAQGRRAYLQEHFRNLAPLVMSHRLGVAALLNRYGNNSPTLKPLTAANQVALFILAPAPDTWRALPQDDQAYETQIEYAIYRIDVFDDTRPAEYPADHHPPPANAADDPSQETP